MSATPEFNVVLNLSSELQMEMYKFGKEKQVWKINANSIALSIFECSHHKTLTLLKLTLRLLI